VPAGVGTPRDLSDPAWQRSVSDAELVTVVRHGRKGMPALLPRIEESDARAIAAFVRLLSPGYEMYERYCTSCHGEDGRGGGGLVEAPAPTVVFDAAYFTRRDPEEVRAAVWHMIGQHKTAMPHLRDELDETTARTIVEYLKGADGP
jgi:mono/diheme cytochrome c family protein